MQIQPVAALAHIIKHYLILESTGAGIKKLRLFSDGNTGIVFTSNKQLSLHPTENFSSQRLPGSFLYGQITTFKDIYLCNKTTLIIVVFHPAGINELLGLPANKLQDLIIKTDDLLGNKASRVESGLFEKNGIQERLSFLNDFFVNLLAVRSPNNGSFIPASLDFIYKHKGLVSLHQLVKFTGYTERHIERKFNASVGMSPKQFINIVKLHNFLKQLNCNGDEENLTRIAYEAGYADQSHLIKAFKKHTGLTPTSYRDKVDKIAVNFVAVDSVTSMSDSYNLSVPA